MERILALDYGAHTVGTAVSDELLLTAQPTSAGIIRRKKPGKLRQTLSAIEELVKAYHIGTIVLGFPLNMDGTEGERCEKTREFSTLLEKRFSLPVIFVDERLTTVEALEEMELSGQKDKKKHVDEAAAMIILQDYLDQEYQKRKENG